MAAELISLQQISRQFSGLDQQTVALDSVSLQIEQGSFVAITGPSGSGKTTLFNILAGFDRADSGSYYYQNELVSLYTEEQLAGWRRRHIGMVFQEYRLLDSLDVYDNLVFSQLCRRRWPDEDYLDGLLETVSLRKYRHNMISELSGGERQRLAVVRALAGQPDLLLADEPTGALDEENTRLIIRLLADQAEKGVTVLVVTHDEKVAAASQRRISLQSGRLVSDDGLVQPEKPVAQTAGEHYNPGRRFIFNSDRRCADHAAEKPDQQPD